MLGWTHAFRMSVVAVVSLSLAASTVRAQGDDPWQGPLPASNAQHWKDLQAQIEKAQPEAVRGKVDAPNGFLLLRALGERIDAERRGRADASGTSQPYNFDAIARPSPDTANEVEAARRGLMAYEALGVFTAIDEIGQTQRAARPPSQGALVSVVLPELGHARALTRALAARFEIAISEGRPVDAVREFDRMLVVGRVHAFGGTLIERLVSLAITSRAGEHLRGAIVAGKLGPAELKLAGESMARRLGDWPSLTLAIEGERLMARDSIDIVYSSAKGELQAQPNPRRLAVIQSMGGTPAGRDGEPALPELAKADELRERAEKVYDQMARAASLPRAKRVGPDGPTLKDGLTNRELVLQILLPAIDKAIQSSDQWATDRAATEAMVAIERFRARTGAYPNALSDLLPAELASEPLDAWSGSALAYRREGEGYRLYSTGLDGKDDGGKADPKNPLRGISRAGAGLDVVYR